MATIEQVEKLREKANVTYDEAKEALEISGDDILDAIIYLERKGKVKAPDNNGYYNSKCNEENKDDNNSSSYSESQNTETFGQVLNRFFKWCGRIIAKGNANMFEVERNGQILITVPVTILVVLLILVFWVVIPLIIIGLFCGCRYRFRGPDLDKNSVNKVMDSAHYAAENFKKDLRDDKENK